MRSRPIAWSWCMLIALSPTLVVVSAAEHMREHRDAAVAPEVHSHHGGHIPHRDHDGDGDPIPISSQPGFLTARPVASGGPELPPALPVAFLTPSDDSKFNVMLAATLGFADWRSRLSIAPRPGENLPLLI